MSIWHVHFISLCNIKDNLLWLSSYNEQTKHGEISKRPQNALPKQWNFQLFKTENINTDSAGAEQQHQMMCNLPTCLFGYVITCFKQLASRIIHWGLATPLRILLAGLPLYVWFTQKNPIWETGYGNLISCGCFAALVTFFPAWAGKGPTVVLFILTALSVIAVVKTTFVLNHNGNR